MVAHASPDIAAERPIHGFRDAEVALIRSLYSAAPQPDFDRFLYIAGSLGLNPLHRQIYLLSYRSGDEVVWQPLCAIDGYRAYAQSTGDRAGTAPVRYNTNDQGQVVSAEFTVFRSNNGRIDQYPAIAYYDEFVALDRYGKVTRFWRDRPFLMIGKCAEALAYRMAFPALAGVYTREEMDRTIEAGTHGSPKPKPKLQDQRVEKLTDVQVLSELNALVRGYEDEAAVVFKSVIPDGCGLAQIAVADARVIVSEPYCARYRKRLADERKRRDAANSAPTQGDGKAPAGDPAAEKTAVQPLNASPAAHVPKADVAPATPEQAPAAGGSTTESAKPSSSRAPDASKAASNVSTLNEAALRTEFASLIDGKHEAARKVFASCLPNGSALDQIGVESLRLILSEPYRSRYETKLIAAMRASSSVS